MLGLQYMVWYMAPIGLSLDQRPEPPLSLQKSEASLARKPPAGGGGVGVECDFELAEEGEEVGFDMAGYGVVVALVDGGESVGFVLANVVYLLDVFWFEVGEAELESVLDGGGGVGETCKLEPACFVDGIDGLE
jgi:hypothetical protein